MKIVMVGTGYVGLVSGTCFSEFGYEVACVDKDHAKIEGLKNGVMPIYEPHLDELVKRNVKAARLFFSTDLKSSLKGADAVFIAVGTPSRRGDGHADLSYVFKTAEEIAEGLEGFAMVITKSTVPVGTGRQVERIIREKRPDLDVEVASNPEFLREGSAIGDFMRPDRVLAGVQSPRAEEFMRRLYRPLNLNETPMVFTSIETAELSKYASNAFLATKVAFINEMADLCESVGADVQHLAKAIGLDGRIGSKFLHPGPGYGGSCFPKDTLALVKTARDANSPMSIIEAVVASNDARKSRMAERVINAMDGKVAGKIIAFLGLAFKPNTDDVRASAAIEIARILSEAGAYLKVYDPKAMEEARKVMGDKVEYAGSAYDAMFEAEALVLATEWNEFRSLDLKKVKGMMKGNLVIDLRNIYKPDEMKQLGYSYYSLGRRPV